MTTIRFVYEDHIVNMLFADETQVDNAFHLIGEADKSKRQYVVFNAQHGKASIRMNFLYAEPIAMEAK